MERKYYSSFNNVTNYLQVLPYLYRYENEEFIDKFFDTGELLISSFHQYKKYKDNQLGDKDEGNTFNVGYTSDDKIVGTMTNVGANDFTFCTSTVLNKQCLKNFKRNSAFRIKDPINFILEINRTLPRVIQVLHGNCIYLNQRLIKSNLKGFTTDQLNDDNEPDKISLQKIFNLSIHGPERYFVKLMKYQKQAEYRIIWNTNRPVNDHIIIKCPEAREFCEKLEPGEIEK